MNERLEVVIEIMEIGFQGIQFGVDTFARRRLSEFNAMNYRMRICTQAN